MTQITAEVIRQSLQANLSGSFEKKFIKELSELSKAKENSSIALVVELEEQLKAEKEKYDLTNWIANELPRMIKGLKFGTHISKGVHPSSKGDNMFFKPLVNLDEEYLVGTHTISEISLDANGNAAALPLATFLETPIDETTLQDLIISDSDALKGAFNKDLKISDEIQQELKEVLVYIPEKPFTDARNKHLLWPIDKDAISEDKYINLIPLHPSSLVNHVFKTVQALRFSDEVNAAKDSRKKNQLPYTHYPIIKDLAVLNLGGTNAQNVSRLNAQQRGRNYLLPSHPPIFTRKGNISLKQSDTSVFNDQLKRLNRDPFNHLKAVAQLNINNKRVRMRRQNALDEIITNILLLSDDIKQEWDKGWSEDFSLNIEEKKWLDPDTFSDSNTDDWSEKVAERFAHWLNQWLQKELKNQKDDFSAQVYLYWKEEMHDILKAKHMES